MTVPNLLKKNNVGERQTVNLFKSESEKICLMFLDLVCTVGFHASVFVGNVQEKNKERSQLPQATAAVSAGQL